MKKRNPFITQAALIAALYVVLTLVSAALGLDSKAIQFRLSGLFIGCLLSNFICGAMLPDMIFGSLATLIGAVGTYFIGKQVKWLSALPPIAANTVIVPLVLKYAYHLDGTVPFFALTVFIGEFVCCGILGTVLLYAIPKRLAAQMK